MLINKILTGILVGVLLFGNLAAQPNSAAKAKQTELSPELQKKRGRVSASNQQRNSQLKIRGKPAIF